MKVTLKAYCRNTKPRPVWGMYLPEHDFFVAMIVLNYCSRARCFEQNNCVLIENANADEMSVFQSIHRNVFKIGQRANDVVVSLKDDFILCSVSVE